MTIVINTFWFGPPSSDGHDLIGPISFHTLSPDSTEFVYQFWCLEKHLEHYQKKLIGKCIQVMAIEPFLKKGFDDERISAHANQLLNMFNALLETGRGKKRDFVTLKDATVLFFLYFPGFHLDTNVIFTDLSKISLKSGISVVYYKEDDASQAKSYDGWLMSSDGNSPDNASMRFDAYLQHFKILENEFFLTGYSEKYHKQCGLIFVLSLCLENPDRRIINFSNLGIYVSEFQFSECIPHHYIDELGIAKYFFNSHLHKQRGQKLVERFIDVLTFQDQFLFKKMVDATDWREIRHEYKTIRHASLLHIAILKKNIEAVNYLLECDANLDDYAYYEPPQTMKNQSYNPYVSFNAPSNTEAVKPHNLAEILKFDEIARAIKDAENKRRTKRQKQ